MKILDKYNKAIPSKIPYRMIIPEKGLLSNSNIVARYEVFLSDLKIYNSDLDWKNTYRLQSQDVVIGSHNTEFQLNLKSVISDTFTSGNYNANIHIHRVLSDLGFYIEEINSSRDEIVVGIHDDTTLVGNTQKAIRSIDAHNSKVEDFLINGLSLDSLAMVLPDGSVITILNNKVFPKAIDPTVFVNPKLNEPVSDIIPGELYSPKLALKLSRSLPKSMLPGSVFVIESLMTNGRNIDLVVPAAIYVEPINKLSAPDFSIPTGETSTPASSRFETFDSLVGANANVKSKILNTYFSSSNDGLAELGVDYRKYDNFIHFSSAKERLENFKYKLEKMEYYDSKISLLDISTSSLSTTNKTQLEDRKNSIIAKFDDYEKYMYFESHSYESGSFGEFKQATWPKTNSSKPYIQATVGSTLGLDWFATQSTIALDYDVDNAYNLEKTIPDHVRLDVQNANYLMFVNMIAQQFDVLYLYADHMNNIHDRQNELHLGLSKDLLWDTLKSLGWTGINGYNFEDLWSSNDGTDINGVYQSTDSGSVQTYINSESMSTSDITKEVWSRTLNNLPYILKTKGTERAIKALLNTYGLPSTVLRVSEYGGSPKDLSTNQYVKYEHFNQSLVMDGSTRIDIPWGQIDINTVPHINDNVAPDVLEFRFNTTNRGSSAILFHNGYHIAIELQHHVSSSNTSSAYYNHGRLNLYFQTGSSHINDMSMTSTDYAPIYDNDWWNVMLSRDLEDNSIDGDQNIFSIRLRKSADHSEGIITHDYSASVSSTEQSYWNDDSPAPLHANIGGMNDTKIFKWTAGVYDGVPANCLPGYIGSIQEIRIWAFANGGRLSDDAFNNHVLSPLSIEGNTYDSSYRDLLIRYPLGSDNKTYDITSNFVVESSHPNQNISGDLWAAPSGLTSTAATLVGFSGTSADWQYEEETFYTAVPEIIGTRNVSDKIRIESEEYVGQLSLDKSLASSSLQVNSPDSYNLGVFFSPVDDIDIDISHQIGGAKFDDFVGNPRDAHRKTYRELKTIQKSYWQKYSTSPTFGAYLKVLKYFDSSIFRQLETLLPARSNNQTGLLIKPNLLERSTIARVSESFANITYEQKSAIKFKPKFNTEFTHTNAMEDGILSGAIPARVKTYKVNGRDLSINASSHFANSFDDSFGPGLTIGNQASQDIPIYDMTRTSIRYTTRGSGSLDIATQVQDFMPTAIKNQRYAGSKYGTVNGSIGGIISLNNDPSVTGEGLFDSTTNIKCAIEVVETNPNEILAKKNNMTHLGKIQIR